MARWCAGLVAVLAALTLAACGGSGGSGSTATSGGASTGGGSASGSATNVNVAVAQTIDAIGAFTAAQQQGYFRQQGLQVKGNVMPYGPGVLASVVSGQNQFAFAVTSDALQAATGGLPIQMVAPGGTTNPDNGVVDALVVKRGGDVTSAKDLEGKTVAVPVLKSLPVLEVQAAAKQAGADPSKIKFVALDFPSMLPAVKSGKIAGAFLVEPFITSSGALSGHGPFDALFKNPDAAVMPEGSTASAWFVTKSYAASNQDVVQKFAKAIGDAQSYLDAHPKAMRKIAADSLKLPQDLAAKIGIGGRSPTINAGSVKIIADKMAQAGLIKQAPDMSQFIYQPGGGG